MVIMVRVDDRLLHGQIICSWVPHTKADSLVVASDEAAGDDLVKEIISSCAHKDLDVEVVGVEEAVSEVLEGCFDKSKVIIIVGNLQDAMRLYEDGMRFTTLNIGNLHHEQDGHMITPSVIVNPRDEEIIERFMSIGVEIDIRAVPRSPAVTFVPGKRTQA